MTSKDLLSSTAPPLSWEARPLDTWSHRGTPTRARELGMEGPTAPVALLPDNLTGGGTKPCFPVKPERRGWGRCQQVTMAVHSPLGDRWRGWAFVRRPHERQSLCRAPPVPQALHLGLGLVDLNRVLYRRWGLGSLPHFASGKGTERERDLPRVTQQSWNLSTGHLTSPA